MSAPENEAPPQEQGPSDAKSAEGATQPPGTTLVILRFVFDLMNPFRRRRWPRLSIVSLLFAGALVGLPALVRSVGWSVLVRTPTGVTLLTIGVGSLGYLLWRALPTSGGPSPGAVKGLCPRCGTPIGPKVEFFCTSCGADVSAAKV